MAGEVVKINFCPLINMLCLKDTCAFYMKLYEKCAIPLLTEVMIDRTEIELHKAIEE